MQIEMIRNADVFVQKDVDDRNRPVVDMFVNSKHQHTFPATSRISKALEVTTIDQIQQRLNGGSFFYVNDELVDFRDGLYKGFVHTDATLHAFMDTIGVSDRSDVRRGRAMNTHSASVALAAIWSRGEIDLPYLREGGEFRSHLAFTWNPFVRTVNTMFDVVRVICDNGMGVITNIFNARIPVMNRWEEHLDIASIQIQNKIESVLGTRVATMTDRRASVAVANQLFDHCEKRAEQAEEEDQKLRLRQLQHVLNPTRLRDVYEGRVFESTNISRQVPSHLSMFDAYNIATEISSHTDETAGSSTHALDRIANTLMFEDKGIDVNHRVLEAPSVSGWSDPDLAFFGAV